MRKLFSVLVMIGVAVGTAATASAQGREPVPDDGTVATGLFIGVASPAERSLASGVDLGAQVDFYLSPRVSLRGQLSRAWLDTIGHSFTGTASPTAFDANVVYNWEGGVWHPYVTGGVGVYHYGFTESNLSSSETKVGVDLGAGLEYFLTRHDTVTGEWLLHAVPGDAHSALATYQARYWTLTAGYKMYFGGR